MWLDSFWAGHYDLLEKDSRTTLHLNKKWTTGIALMKT